MSPDKPVVANDAKKKATIAIVAIVAIVIAWQLKGLLGGSKPAPVAPAPVAMTAANKPMANGAPPAAGMPNAAAPAGAPTGAPAGTPTGAPAAAPIADQVPRVVPVQVNAELMKLQKETEAKYIAALNELQMLKLQRDIAEVNQAIAKSKLDTLGTEKSITDLLTVKPPAPPAQVPDSEYANMMTEGSGGTDSTSLRPPGQEGPAGSDKPAAPIAPGTAIYTVLSVSQQNNKWSAVLGSNGKLFSVNAGDTVSLDGTLVSSISRDGVVIEQKGVKKKITISSTL